jgi:hypothetical protein
MQYQNQGGYPNQSPYRDGNNMVGAHPPSYQASPPGQMAGQMSQSHPTNDGMMMAAAGQRPASMNQSMGQQGMYGSQGGQRRGAGNDPQVKDLMQQVEDKRMELENMTLSVVQWKQTFKDKIQHEKADYQRDVDREKVSRAQGFDVIVERMSLRMLTLCGRLCLADAFQKLRFHRKQVLWLQRVKELKTQCETFREEATIAVTPPPDPPSSCPSVAPSHSTQP